jgi:hypothetical protein
MFSGPRDPRLVRPPGHGAPVIASLEELHRRAPRTDLSSIVRYGGPATPVVDAGWQRPAWWTELESGKTVVLVDQGTVATQTEELLPPALDALAAEDDLGAGRTATTCHSTVRFAGLATFVVVAMRRLQPMDGVRERCRGREGLGGQPSVSSTTHCR